MARVALSTRVAHHRETRLHHGVLDGVAGLAVASQLDELGLPHLVVLVPRRQGVGNLVQQDEVDPLPSVGGHEMTRQGDGSGAVSALPEPAPAIVELELPARAVGQVLLHHFDGHVACFDEVHAAYSVSASCAGSGRISVR